jgi:hypothetical protein
LGDEIIKCCEGEIVGGGVVVCNTNCCFWEENKEKIASCKTVMFKIVYKIIMTQW